MTIMAGMYLLYLKITLRSQEQSWIRGPMVNHSPPPPVVILSIYGLLGNYAKKLAMIT